MLSDSDKGKSLTWKEVGISSPKIARRLCGSSELKNNCRRVRHKVTKPITGDWTWKPWLIEAGRAPVPARILSREFYVLYILLQSPILHSSTMEFEEWLMSRYI